MTQKKEPKTKTRTAARLERGKSAREKRKSSLRSVKGYREKLEEGYGRLRGRHVAFYSSFLSSSAPPSLTDLTKSSYTG